MKLIVIISLILLSAIACEDAFDRKWCGNSKINVEIVSKHGQKQVVTKASIVVPSSLDRIKSLDLKSLKLIPKSEQGLVLSLDGKAQAEQLGNIYNYDEDDTTQIFIPYLYLTSIENNFDKFTVSMARTFKGESSFNFNIVPVPDAFGTNLCKCQFEMFNDRITANLTRRKSLLTNLVNHIVGKVTEFSSLSEQLKKAIASKVDTTELNNTIKAKEQKQKACEALRATETALNQEISNNIVQKEKNIKQGEYLDSALQYYKAAMENNLKEQQTQNGMANPVVDLLTEASIKCNIIPMQMTNIRNMPEKRYIPDFMKKMADYQSFANDVGTYLRNRDFKNFQSVITKMTEFGTTATAVENVFKTALTKYQA